MSQNKAIRLNMKKSKNSSATLSEKLKQIPNKATIGCIRFYQRVFSPSLGFLRYLPFYPKPTCIFYPTCSEYAITCFSKYSFFSAFYKSFRRVGRCHPGNPPSVDLP